MSFTFKKRNSVEEVEEGTELQPKFDNFGLIPVITTNEFNHQILMHGYMNEEALKKSIQTGYAHYWSRSRKCIWKKGETSGLKQKIIEMKIDDDQDCIWIEVRVSGNGASCHVGYKSCFYRKVEFKDKKKIKLKFTELKKIFNPKDVYGNAPNPTKL
tara:strand:+ start:36 stop:506 length:471 start_codon:yes stop_codon:yes gene_type:complete